MVTFYVRINCHWQSSTIPAPKVLAQNFCDLLHMHSVSCRSPVLHFTFLHTQKFFDTLREGEVGHASSIIFPLCMHPLFEGAPNLKHRKAECVSGRGVNVEVPDNINSVNP